MQTLVLIPGLGSDAAVWQRTIAALGDKVECRVGDTLSDDSLADMAARILGKAPKRFAFAGVSMGGMVALEMMRIAPERVSHLALVDTTVSPDTVSQRAYRHLSNVVVSNTRDFSRLAERSLGSLVHQSALERVRTEMVEMSKRVDARAYVRQNRAVIARGDLRKVLASIRVPTSVIVGEHDHLTPVRLSEDIHQRIQGSTLEVIPDCGHLPPIEKPEAVATLLCGLLARN